MNKKRSLSLLLALLMVIYVLPVSAASMPGSDFIAAYEGVLKYLQNEITPTVGSNGGEWAVFALARAGVIDAGADWAQGYLEALDSALENGEIAGSTDYERVTLAVTALGLDAANYNGRDLTEIYKTYNRRLAINGKTFALLSLNSRPYSGDADAYVQALTEAALSGGGWTLYENGDADIDVTAMAIQALAPYYETDAQVSEVVDLGLSWIISRQDEETGGFVGMEGIVSTCSTAQVIVALTALNIDPASGGWTTDGGRSALDAMLDHYNSEGGYFGEFDDLTPDQMASEQAAYALVAYQRFLCGSTSLYDMSDIDSEPHKKDEDTYWEEGVFSEADEDSSVDSGIVEQPYTDEFSIIDPSAIKIMADAAADYIYKTVPSPQVGTIGGEWAVLGLARSGADIPAEYFENYYRAVEAYVRDCKGVLHEKKYTEYSRVVIALTAIGKDPANVAGYNLLTPLGDFNATAAQGINGTAWALIALDSGSYEMPENSVAMAWATREMYVNYILENQLNDGGWSLAYETSDADVTAMMLQALSKYRDNEAVNAAIERALVCMADMLNDGGFSSRGKESSESCAQMIVALSELGIPLNDPRFVKNGKNLFDELEAYYIPGGGFKLTKGVNIPDRMATEQALYALVAAKRFIEGENSLYSMSDAVSISGDEGSRAVGLPGKDPDVRKADIVSPGKTFTDIQGHTNQAAIEALTARNIIYGKSETAFEPGSHVTRAEFAAIITRSLGLPVKAGKVFADVTAEDWYFDCVNTAYSYGIIKGVSEAEFDPNGEITREEAAVMVARAAGLCGMDTEFGAFEARNVLAGFSDYVKASDWAISSLAFCYGKAVLPDEVMEIKPKEAVTRAEIAGMLYNMLYLVKLL